MYNILKKRVMRAWSVKWMIRAHSLTHIIHQRLLKFRNSHILNSVNIFCSKVCITNNRTMKLGDSVVKSFRVAKVFRDNTDKINSIDFAPNGETLISGSDDDSIVIYDCANEGK